MSEDQPIPFITEPPNPSDPEELYDEKAYNALVSWNASVRAANIVFQTLGLNFNATSHTSADIGGGLKNFIVEPGLFLIKGMTLKAIYTPDIRKSMRGEIESYNKTTGALVLDVTKAIGNGTYADWTFSIAIDGGSEANLGYGVTTGTSTAYELELAEPISEYKDGQIFFGKVHTTCDTNATLRVSGLNPPLDKKIQDAYGEYVNVYKGDLTEGHYTLYKVINGGTAVLCEPAINAASPVGDVITYVGFAPKLNTFEIPFAASDISRAAYPHLLKHCIKSNPVTISIATPGVVSWVGHGLENGSPVYLTTTGALPTGHTVNAKRYVVNKTTDNFQLSLTKGGAAISTTGTQSGVHTAHYAPFGNGNGTTTFGCPHLPQDYAAIRGVNGNLGEASVGENLSHVHGGANVFYLSQGYSHDGNIDGSTTSTPSDRDALLSTNYSSGGAANLAAGMRFMILLVYK